MGGWIDTYDGVFFISLSTIIVSAFGVAVRYCLKSKCEHFSLCFGLINVDRRVDLEVQEHIREMELGVEEKEEETTSVRRPSIQKREPDTIPEKMV